MEWYLIKYDKDQKLLQGTGVCVDEKRANMLTLGTANVTSKAIEERWCLDEGIVRRITPNGV